LCIVQLSKYAAALPDRYVLVFAALQAVLKEVSDSNGKIVLFIDEIHTVVGAGATGGAMDAGAPGLCLNMGLSCAGLAQWHLPALQMCAAAGKPHRR
jgi:hypothetical protein